MSKQPVIFTAEQVAQQDEVRVSHPLNPKSEMYYRSLTEPAGFDSCGLHLVRVPSGQESNELHSHRIEEEFYFVLEGRALLLVDGEEHELGPGGFAAFPGGATAHLMTNPYDKDLLYLVGGSRSAFEMGEFPRHGKTLIRTAGKGWIVDSDRLEEPDWRFTDED